MIFIDVVVYTLDSAEGVARGRQSEASGPQ